MRKMFHPVLVVLLSNIVFELNPPGAGRSPLCREAHVHVLICRERNPYSATRLFLNVAPLRHVQTVQKLSDILVTDFADLLDVGGTLGDVLEALCRCQYCAVTGGDARLRFR
jgi:hypothetical protein